jgi:hypothetical protein
MNKVTESNVEPRKEWVTPELKKVDIEQITAAGTNSAIDGAFTANS